MRSKNLIPMHPNFWADFWLVECICTYCLRLVKSVLFRPESIMENIPTYAGRSLGDPPLMEDPDPWVSLAALEVYMRLPSLHGQLRVKEAGYQISEWTGRMVSWGFVAVPTRELKKKLHLANTWCVNLIGTRWNYVAALDSGTWSLIIRMRKILINIFPLASQMRIDWIA
jgi:hypothetical protein